MASACATLALAAPADAKDTGLTISSAPTQNIQCGSGVCAPTAATAILNVGDLEAMLASGNIEVTTSGSGVDASNLNVKATVAWSSANTLSLAATDNVTISKPIAVQGDGGLSLSSATGFNVNSLYFAGSGSVTFDNVADSLVINGTTYTLANSIAMLASDISAYPGGSYALANSYNAKHDGIYSGAPIATPFTGVFEGLGNRITNLSINDSSGGEYVGLFGEVGSNSDTTTIRDIGLKNVTVTANGATGTVDAGALVGWLWEGFIVNSYAIGTVTVSGTGSLNAGGLVGYTYDYVENSFANCAVSATGTGSASVNAGGLAGIGDAINNSIATGTVTAQGAGNLVAAGGLLGNQDSGGSFVGNSYATGAASASGGSRAVAGGLIGYEPDGSGTVFSYSTGTASASGGSGNIAGGLIGVDVDYDNNSDNYWDTTTSNTNTGVGQGNDSGVTGMTTQQLQSGLPAGFNPPTWGEKASINNGMPYLPANKPRS